MLVTYFSYPVTMQHDPFLGMPFCKLTAYCHLPHIHLFFFVLMMSVNGSLPCGERSLSLLCVLPGAPCPFLQTLNCSNWFFFPATVLNYMTVNWHPKRGKNLWLFKCLVLSKVALPQCTWRRKKSYTACDGEWSGLYHTFSSLLWPFSNLATLTSSVIPIHTYPNACKNENITPHVSVWVLI